jgi:solute carrier family 13 (sodium-dependent dicarboxylate transporter), member 2/3/5
MTKLQIGGLVAGIIGFLLVLLLPAPEGLSPEGWRMVAVAVLMAAWWMTEAIPIEVTGMVPLVLFPVLGVLSMPDAAAPYANELIFLFMGGFFVAAAMERWNLHTRIALAIVAAVGTGPRMLILGFMVATGFISMWISNTATAAMMLPMGLALGEMYRPSDHEGRYEFGIALMLGTAYAASIGGLGTLIGTPPNAVVAGAASEMLGIRIGFLQWMMIGVPLVLILLPLTWLLLITLYPPGELSGDAEALITEKRRSLGPLSRGEKSVGVVFVVTALAWIFRENKEFDTFTLPGLEALLPSVTDATIAMAAAVALFLIPVDARRGEFVLDWKTGRRIPWGVLVLFGGGLSLARAMEVTGVATWIGGHAEALRNLPLVVVVAAIVALIVLLGEIASNTATATMAMPIMAGLALGLDVAPVVLMTIAGVSASIGFMLPAATPPNAIVFGSGYLSIPDMVKAGFWLDVISIVVVTIAAATVIPAVLN